MKVAVIGGGAAGFFAAINCKDNFPSSQVIIFEKTQKILSKVKVSGGGRCNVTNGCTGLKDLVAGYPRGNKVLKKLFPIFNNQSTMQWFEQRGVALKTEDDNRVFPISDSSQTIIDCLLCQTKKLNIEIRTGTAVHEISNTDDIISLTIGKERLEQSFDKVIVACGGTPKIAGLNWLKNLGHEIISPIPSLFTFNMPNEAVKSLMGVAIPNVSTSIQGTKLKAQGPLLITHWGMSGPAILKLSSFGARDLYDMGYNFTVQINWVSIQNQDDVKNDLMGIVDSHPKKNIANIKPYDLPERFWLFLLKKAEIPAEKKWHDLGKKGIHKIVQLLTNDTYEVKGKTTFKEEFVTCGGISISSINAKTMESKSCPNIYFAGEILNIDGITGGYNFQAAWTTAFIAARLN